MTLVKEKWKEKKRLAKLKKWAEPQEII
jgi:hypothetical protein